MRRLAMAAIASVSLTLACASAPMAARVALDLPGASAERKVVRANGFVVRYNKVGVKDRPEALQVLENRRGFLLDLFKNSSDPYFGTPRWSEECLAQNQIGPSASERGSNHFISRLNVSDKFGIGECGPETYHALLLNSYCPAQGAVVEALVRPESRGAALPETARIECEGPLRLTF